MKKVMQVLNAEINRIEKDLYIKRGSLDACNWPPTEVILQMEITRLVTELALLYRLRTKLSEATTKRKGRK